MYLVHMHGETWKCVSSDHPVSWTVGIATSGSVESATTSFAFKMLSFLMGNKNLEIIEITLTWRVESVTFWSWASAGTYSSSTKVEQGAPRHLGVRASSCQPL